MKRGVAHLAKSSKRPKTAINIGVPISLPRLNINLVVNVADRHAVATDSTRQISLIIVLFTGIYFLNKCTQNPKCPSKVTWGFYCIAFVCTFAMSFAHTKAITFAMPFVNTIAFTFVILFALNQ